VKSIKNTGTIRLTTHQPIKTKLWIIWWKIKKYIAVNQLQNTALKQILELRFIDMIRNKHKKDS